MHLELLPSIFDYSSHGEKIGSTRKKEKNRAKFALKNSSLVGCRLWGRTELDTTAVTQQQQPENQSKPPHQLGPKFLKLHCHDIVLGDHIINFYPKVK